jgi:flagellar basal body-associated protein FliL
MKVAIIVLLVLLNLGIFAYFQFAQSSPQPALPELNPEKIKILTEQELQARANVAVETPVELAPQQ